MKTQEEVVRQHAVGPINIYRIYQEGYQDHELDDWAAFRREAAKGILAVAFSSEYWKGFDTEVVIRASVEAADGLIKRLKEEGQ